MWVSVHYPHISPGFWIQFVSDKNTKRNPHLVIAGLREYGEGIDFREGKMKWTAW